jgi:hypothetical protein
MSPSVSQRWHDLLDDLENAVAHVRPLCGQHAAPIEGAFAALRTEADKAGTELLATAEADGKQLGADAQAAAAPVVHEAVSDAESLGATAVADLGQPLPTEAPASPETTPDPSVPASA